MDNVVAHTETGPNGVRGTQGDYSFSNLVLRRVADILPVFNGVPSSCFPASTGLGSSFDIDLAQKVGKALGDECRAKSKGYRAPQVSSLITS